MRRMDVGALQTSASHQEARPTYAKPPSQGSSRAQRGELEQYTQPRRPSAGYGPAPPPYGSAQSRGYGPAPSPHGSAPSQSGYGPAPSSYGPAPFSDRRAPPAYDARTSNYGPAPSGYGPAPSPYVYGSAPSPYGSESSSRSTRRRESSSGSADGAEPEKAADLAAERAQQAASQNLYNKMYYPNGQMREDIDKGLKAMMSGGCPVPGWKWNSKDMDSLKNEALLCQAGKGQHPLDLPDLFEGVPMPDGKSFEHEITIMEDGGTCEIICEPVWFLPSWWQWELASPTKMECEDSKWDIGVEIGDIGDKPSGLQNAPKCQVYSRRRFACLLLLVFFVGCAYYLYRQRELKRQLEATHLEHSLGAHDHDGAHDHSHDAAHEEHTEEQAPHPTAH